MSMIPSGIQLSEKALTGESFNSTGNSMRVLKMHFSIIRPQCTLCLPQHVAKGPLTRDERRVLKPRTVVPDGALFLWSPTVKKRSYALPSAYKIIANHTSTKRVCGRGNDSSFKSQATPCAASSQGVGFEFISCVWEDKKPSLAHFDQAYRQNRMSAAASLRHLHSLRIQAPVFGLLWADGIVRAHVDWCQYQEGEQLVRPLKNLRY